MKKTPKTRPSKDAASAEQLAIGARIYYECAIAADEKFWGNLGAQQSALYPVLDGICHSIELSLKSYLKFQGVDEDLRTNHWIKGLHTECVQMAKKLSEDFPDFDEELLEVVDDVHGNKTLRFDENPRGFRCPIFQALDAMARSLLARVKAPRMAELTVTN